MLQIDSIDDLMALNRALMQTRFLARNVDLATRGSAILSDLHGRVIHEIIASHDSTDELTKANSWRKWREFPPRTIEQAAIIEYLTGIWPRLRTPESKRAAAENQMRPFTYSGRDVDDILARAEAAAKK